MVARHSPSMFSVVEAEMPKSFLQRRHEKNPDYAIEVWITGVRVGGGIAHYDVHVEGEDDPDFAAGILERAAEVLRDPNCS